MTTAGLIPFEIRALLHHLRVGRVILLVLNVAIVAYLIVNIRFRRRAHAAEAEFETGHSALATGY